jgi:hypothetical protein
MPDYIIPSTLFWTVVFTRIILGGAMIRFPVNFDLSAPQILIPAIFLVSIGLVPWIGVVADKWFGFGLVQWWILPDVLKFVSIYTALFWLGFWSICGIHGRKQDHETSVDRDYDHNLIILSPAALLMVSAIFTILQAIPLWNSFWFSGVPRGFGQWDDWDFTRYVALLGMIGQLLCIVLSGIAWSEKRSDALFLVPISQMFLLASKLSRGMFVPILLFIMAAHVSGLKIKKLFIYVSLFTILGAGVVIVIRGQTDAWGLSRLIYGINGININQIPRGVIASSDTIEALTMAFSLRNESLDAFKGFIEWVWTLMPLPTFMGWFDRREVSLADVMGIEGGSTGIPFSHLGEVFFRMGWWGALIGFGVGAWFGYLQKKVHDVLWVGGNPRWQYVLLYVTSIYGLIISFHSATRAATRPVFYAALLILVHLIFEEIDNRIFGEKVQPNLFLNYAKGEKSASPVENGFRGSAK